MQFYWIKKGKYYTFPNEINVKQNKTNTGIKRVLSITTKPGERVKAPPKIVCNSIIQLCTFKSSVCTKNTTATPTPARNTAPTQTATVVAATQSASIQVAPLMRKKQIVHFD